MSKESEYSNNAFDDFTAQFFERYPIKESTLSNGLKILLQEDHDLPVTSLYTLFKTGSRNERPGITGISHLFEHMMFNGSRKFGPKEFDSILERGGGYSNAYTSRDLTVYYEDFTPSLLETVLDLESDRMGWLDLSKESLKSERQVVMEERRLRTDDSVFGRLDEELFAASFQCHSYRWPIIGWMDDIKNIKLSDCNRYFRQYYAPNNAIIMLAGDINSQKSIELFDKYYSGIKKRRIPSDRPTVEPEQNGEKRVYFHKKSELHNFITGYRIPAIGHNDLYTLDIIQTLLTDGRSSILYRKLVREDNLALYTMSNCSWRIDPGIFIIYFQMKPGRTSEEGEKALEAELDRIASDGVDKADLERARNMLEAEFIMGLQTNNGRAHRIVLSEYLFGDWSKLFEPVKHYRKVSEDDVKRVIKKYLHPDNRTTVTLIPGK